MTSSYTESLVHATTEDGLLLAGLVIRPTSLPARPHSIIWIHGNAASFSAPSYVAIGRELAALGYPAVIGDTRGHNIAATLWRADRGMPGGGGAGWERLEEAPRDLAAWMDVAAPLAPGSVILAGHSSGAQRVVLYQAERQDARIAGLALASPDLRGFFPPGELEAARRLVAEGRGQEVTPAQPWAPWYRQSAETVVSKADILSRLLEAENGESAIAALRTPLLAFYGSTEPAGEGTLEAIRRNARGLARFDTDVIAGADHFYTGHEAAVAAALARWAAALSQTESA